MTERLFQHRNIAAGKIGWAFLKTVTLLLVVLLNTILVRSLFAAQESMQIHLLTSATVDGESICLGQIATIDGTDAAAVDALRVVEVGRSPLPGQSIYLHPNRIEAALKQQTGSLEPYQIIAAGSVKVVRQHHTVNASQIRDAVIGYIQTHAPWDMEQMKIRPLQYDQEIIVPPGEVAIQVAEPKHNDWIGQESFGVIIMVNGEPVKRTAIGINIEVWQDVYLAAKPLAKNQPITAEEIKIQKMNLAGLPANAIVREDQVIGRRANRSIAINSILRQDQVEREPMVRKGDLVQVLAESSVLRVSTQAVAQEHGCAGDRILLLNVNSKKNIYGRVVDGQTVKVEF